MCSYIKASLWALYHKLQFCASLCQPMAKLQSESKTKQRKHHFSTSIPIILSFMKDESKFSEVIWMCVFTFVTSECNISTAFREEQNFDL